MITILILWISIIVYAYMMYLSYRTFQVSKFNLEIVDRIFNNRPYDDCKVLLKEYEKISYNKMLLFPKPLKLEYWFSKEFIKLLNNN